MNDEIIVFELPDGSVRYATCPSQNKKPGETKSQWLLRVFNKTITSNPEYTGAKRILNHIMPDGKPLVPGQNDHPVEHAFPGTWRHLGGGNIRIDMPSARVIKMDQIRRARDSYFPPLDAEWMKAMGQGDAAMSVRIETQRQHLRDIPQTVGLEAISTPEALMAFEPNWTPTEE